MSTKTGEVHPIDAFTNPTPYAVFSDFFGIQGRFWLNNNDEAAVIGLKSDYVNQIAPFQFDLSSANPYADVYPALADTGMGIAAISDGVQRGLMIFNPDGSRHTPLAGLLPIGKKPSISDDGRIIAFCGDLAPAGADAINAAQGALQHTDAAVQPVPLLYPGKGIFAYVQTELGRILVRVAGLSGNGFLDPGEYFNDTNKNRKYDLGEPDQGTFTDFVTDSRVCVGNSGVVVFVARDEDSITGVYSADLIVDDSKGICEFRVPDTGEFVARVGDSLPGAGTIQGISLHDSVNSYGDIAFWADLGGGASAVVRRLSAPIRAIEVGPGELEAQRTSGYDVSDPDDEPMLASAQIRAAQQSAASPPKGLEYPIFRRGNLARGIPVSLRRLLDPTKEKLVMSFERPDGKTEVIEPPATLSAPIVPNEWYFEVTEMRDQGPSRIQFYVPTTAQVGVYGNWKVDVVNRQTKKVEQEVHIVPESFSGAPRQAEAWFGVVFNPFEPLNVPPGDEYKDKEVFDIDPRHHLPTDQAKWYTADVEEKQVGDKGQNYYGDDPQESWRRGGQVKWELACSRRALEIACETIPATVRSSARGVTGHLMKDCSARIMEGLWGQDYIHWISNGGHGCDWRDSAAILRDYDNSILGIAMVGQCMDYSGLLCTLLRNTGIPARMVTCTGATPLRASGRPRSSWNFHCWNRAYVSNGSGHATWLEADATIGEPLNSGGVPKPPVDAVMKDQMQVFSHVYTENMGNRENVTSAYGPFVAEVSGTVTDSKGAGVGADLSFKPAGGPGVWRSRTNWSGEYHVRYTNPSVPKDGILRATPSDSPRGQIKVYVKEETKPGTTVNVGGATVRTDWGQKEVKRNVQLVGHITENFKLAHYDGLTEGQAGTATLSVVPGTYTVTFAKPCYYPQQKASITVGNGQTVSIVFDVQRVPPPCPPAVFPAFAADLITEPQCRLWADAGMYGDNVTIHAALENPTASEISTQILVDVTARGASLPDSVAQFGPETVTVPPSDTVVKEYTLTRDQYVSSGSLVVTASAFDDTAACSVQVPPSHELQVQCPGTLQVDTDGAVSLTVKNTMNIPTTGMKAVVSVAGNAAGGEEQEVVFPPLAPGASAEGVANLRFTRGGTRTVYVVLSSNEGEAITDSATVRVSDPSDPSVCIEAPPVPDLLTGSATAIKATITNLEPVAVSGLVAQLRMENELSTAARQKELPMLGAGEATELTWNVDAVAAGRCHYEVVVLKGSHAVARYTGSADVSHQFTEFTMDVSPTALPAGLISDVQVDLSCVGTVSVKLAATCSEGITSTLLVGGVPIVGDTVSVSGSKTLVLRVSSGGHAGAVVLTAEPKGDPVRNASVVIDVEGGGTDFRLGEDGDFVAVFGPAGEGLLVSAVFPDCLYIQSDDRSMGVRVKCSNTGLAVGMKASAVGTLQTNPNGERYIDAVSVQRLGNSQEQVLPLGMIQRSVGGGDWAYDPGPPVRGQRGVTGGNGLNNIGLLIRICGQVTQFGAGYLYVDDGSQVSDGTQTGAQENVGVRVVCDPSPYRIGDFLVITGISSCFKTPSGAVARRVLARLREDIEAVQLGDEVFGSIGALKRTALGRNVTLHAGVVTASAEQMGGFMYVEDAGRASGIRVATTDPRGLGDEVSVSGSLEYAESGELQVGNGTTAFLRAVDPLTALGLHVAALGGGPFGVQPGVLGGTGLNNLGLLVRIAGEVTFVDGQFLTVWDGSSLAALPPRDPDGNVGVRVNAPAMIPPGLKVGDFVSVIGISSCTTVGENLHPLVRARSSGDIQRL